MCVFVGSALAKVSGLEEHQLDAGPGIGIAVFINHENALVRIRPALN
jgi:hypothetical protein